MFTTITKVPFSDVQPFWFMAGTNSLVLVILTDRLLKIIFRLACNPIDHFSSHLCTLLIPFYEQHLQWSKSDHRFWDPFWSLLICFGTPMISVNIPFSLISRGSGAKHTISSLLWTPSSLTPSPLPSNPPPHTEISVLLHCYISVGALPAFG